MYKNVLDFIEYSNGDVEVICDINYEISGEYDCLYKLNDIEVIKNIKVIKEKSNINIKEEKENISINKEEIRNNYIDKITIDENVSELVKIQKQNNIENKENDDNKYKLLIIKYVFFLFFICLEIILYIKRKKRKKRIVESI